MATICFYQDARHAKPLEWMREIFDIGYLSNRKDGITELKINGFASVRKILLLLRPYLRFKVKQADALVSACKILEIKKIGELSKEELRHLVDLVFEIKHQNYKSHSSLTKEILLHRLDLTP